MWKVLKVYIQSFYKKDPILDKNKNRFVLLKIKVQHKSQKIYIKYFPLWVDIDLNNLKRLEGKNITIDWAVHWSWKTYIFNHILYEWKRVIFKNNP